MAKDALLLRRATAGVVSLRIYQWDRLTLSIGRAQKVERQVDLAACATLGIPVVRRETGGWAVLHGSDITYSIAAPLHGTPFQGGILAIYRAISHALLHFFSGLGLGPHAQAYSGRERLEAASPVCFATPSAFEILLGGKKIVGSAQRQIPGAFLQHGSIPLSPQEQILARVFRGASPVDIASRMTDLSTAGVQVHPGGLGDRLVQAFAAVFEAKMVSAAWTAADNREANMLMGGFPWLNPAPAQSSPAPAGDPAWG
jgi:lipoate-protein ligase A